MQTEMLTMFTLAVESIILDYLKGSLITEYFVKKF